jgi:hypothetical protein
MLRAGDRYQARSLFRSDPEQPVPNDLERYWIGLANLVGAFS